MKINQNESFKGKNQYNPVSSETDCVPLLQIKNLKIEGEPLFVFGFLGGKLLNNFPLLLKRQEEYRLKFSSASEVHLYVKGAGKLSYFISNDTADEAGLTIKSIRPIGNEAALCFCSEDGSEYKIIVHNQGEYEPIYSYDNLDTNSDRISRTTRSYETKCRSSESATSSRSGE